MNAITSHNKVSDVFCSISQDHSNNFVLLNDVFDTTSLDDLGLVTKLVVESL